MATRTRIQVEHSLSPEQAKALRGYVAELVHTSIAESWTGSGDPCDAPVIEAELALAKAKFDAFVTKLSTENGG